MYCLIDYFIYYVLRYMEKRKPYNLKWLMAVYNLLQVVACCYLIHGVCFDIIKENIIRCPFIKSFCFFFQTITDNEYRRFATVRILEV